jgi:integrase
MADSGSNSVIRPLSRNGRSRRVSPQGHGERDRPERERKADRRLGSRAADAGARWEGRAGIEEATMQTTIPTLVGFAKTPWNKGRLVGQKRPLKPKEVWAIRIRLQLEGRRRDLAFFNLAIDSKLRGCDLVSLRVDDVCVGGRVRDRATVIQKKTGRPVQFEITEQTRSAVRDWLFEADLRAGRYLFPSRFRAQPHLSTRQYARIVHSWVAFVRMRARHHCVVRRELGSSAALGGDLQLRQFNARFNLPGCERKH